MSHPVALKKSYFLGVCGGVGMELGGQLIVGSVSHCFYGGFHRYTHF